MMFHFAHHYHLFHYFAMFCRSCSILENIKINGIIEKKKKMEKVKKVASRNQIHLMIILHLFSTTLSLIAFY